MKIKNLYIYAIALVLICTSLVLEYHEFDDYRAISVLLQAYCGVNLYGNISGYTLALYIGINASLIIITINSVNSIFDMYKYIYIRCHTNNRFILLCLQNCIYQAISITIINLIINFCSFILLDKRIDIDCINLSVYLFIYIVELFIFECVLFSIKFKFKSSVLLIFSMTILMPILNSINPNIFKWIVFFPSSKDLLDYKIIILKVIMIIILLCILKVLLKKYDDISNENESA